MTLMTLGLIPDRHEYIPSLTFLSAPDIKQRSTLFPDSRCTFEQSIRIDIDPNERPDVCTIQAERVRCLLTRKWVATTSI